MPRLDPHSYADSEQPQTQSIELALDVDFASRTLAGEIALRFREPGAGPLDLDTRDLRVESVTDLQGQPLRIELAPGTPGVRIRSTTSAAASALQWLTPAQTAGGQQPFLFSQCQPIHA